MAVSFQYACVGCLVVWRLDLIAWGLNVIGALRPARLECSEAVRERLMPIDSVTTSRGFAARTAGMLRILGPSANTFSIGYAAGDRGQFKHTETFTTAS